MSRAAYRYTAVSRRRWSLSSRSSVGPVPTLVIIAALIVVGALGAAREECIRPPCQGGRRQCGGRPARRRRMSGGRGGSASSSARLAASVAGIIIRQQTGRSLPSRPALTSCCRRITAAFIGAATFRFGEFNIFGTVVGVLVTQIAANGLILLGVPNYTTYVFQGVILLVALDLCPCRRIASA